MLTCGPEVNLGAGGGEIKAREMSKTAAFCKRKKRNINSRKQPWPKGGMHQRLESGEKRSQARRCSTAEHKEGAALGERSKASESGLKRSKGQESQSEARTTSRLKERGLEDGVTPVRHGKSSYKMVLICGKGTRFYFTRPHCCWSRSTGWMAEKSTRRTD